MDLSSRQAFALPCGGSWHCLVGSGVLPLSERMRLKFNIKMKSSTGLPGRPEHCFIRPGGEYCLSKNSASFDLAKISAGGGRVECRVSGDSRCGCVYGKFFSMTTGFRISVIEDSGQEIPSVCLSRMLPLSLPFLSSPVLLGGQDHLFPFPPQPFLLWG